MTTTKTDRELAMLRRRNDSIAAAKRFYSDRLKADQDKRDAEHRTPTQLLADRLLREAGIIK